VVGVELPGGQHGFDLLCSWRGSAVLAGIEAFLAEPRVIGPVKVRTAAQVRD
jgi:hypothetical protein